MREIKFRAWDKKENKMYHHDDFGMDGTWIFRIDYQALGGCPNEGEETYDVVRGLGHAGDTFDLMQYTGFRDRKDADVYEGDIVLHDAYDDPRKYTVEFSVKGGGWVLARPDHRMNLSAMCKPNYEVVGNTHENPELLDTKRPKG